MLGHNIFEHFSFFTSINGNEDYVAGNIFKHYIGDENECCVDASFLLIFITKIEKLISNLKYKQRCPPTDKLVVLKPCSTSNKHKMNDKLG